MRQIFKIKWTDIHFLNSFTCLIYFLNVLFSQLLELLRFCFCSHFQNGRARRQGRSRCPKHCGYQPARATSLLNRRYTMLGLDFPGAQMQRRSAKHGREEEMTHTTASLPRSIDSEVPGAYVPLR